MAIKHTKYSAIPDIGDPALVQASDWNSEHTVEDGTFTIAKTIGLRAELDDRQIAGDPVTTSILEVSGSSELGTLPDAQVTVCGLGVFQSTITVTNSTVSGQVIATVDATKYGSASFVIQARDVVGGKFHIATVLVVHNGVIADYNEYGAIDVGGVCGTYSADFAGDLARLLVHPTSSNATEFKVLATMLTQ